MKILVTGANGYLGSGIVKSLLDKGYEVVATDLKTDNIDERAKKIECDLFEIDDPYLFFDKPEVLLHLAWREGFVHYSPSHVEDLYKHYCFIEKIAKSEIDTIAGMGSMHEIGFFEGSINENTPCNPESYYGISKNALRELTKVITQKNNKRFLWLRGYYIVGNSELGESIFSKIIKANKEGKKTFPFTMGTNQYDFLDYDLFCEKVAASVVQKEISGIINICSGSPERLADRVERFILENKLDIKLEYGAFPDRKYDSKAVWGDSTKIDLIMNNSKE